MVVWNIWKVRNSYIFRNQTFKEEELFQNIFVAAWSWLRFRTSEYA